MQQNECTRNCWIAAGVVGLLVWIFASFIGSTPAFGGLFLGLIATVLMGLFLVWALCRGSGSAEDDRHHGLTRANPSSTIMPLQGAAPVATTAAPAPAPAPKPAPAPAASAPAAVTEAKAEPAPAPAPKPAPKPASEKPAEPKAQKKAEPKAVEKPVAKKDAKPAAKSAKAKPDDLKQIKGVGPKLEQLLHENGITQFAQIAAWGEAEIDEFAEKIGSMGGRIRSDDWIAQARTLAEGGSTEFASRVKKGDVY
ncbi:endonuclease [uncultured Paracoccus sp.]|uniref:endonuclease n=1 Tax=uncultured Paracoccus sp. TaxID=189685 RepID=UPI00261E54D9|nr:endonuclease [uncultured Paracoccus sp.]